jgi:hypothetical protein
VDRAEKMEKQMDPAPWQFSLSHLSCRAVVFDEEPNSNHTPATTFSRTHFIWPLGPRKHSRVDSKVIFYVHWISSP